MSLLLPILVVTISIYKIIQFLFQQIKTESFNLLNKRIAIIVGWLQIFHVFFFLSGLIVFNPYISFYICVVISMLCFLLSIWMILPVSKFEHEIKYIFAFLSVFQILTTIYLFLLPEAGLPPLIQF